jgi:phytoene synthase
MLDRPREVALKTVPAEVRPALRALWDIDIAFADVVSTTLTVQLGAIRLAWWRERLEELDRGISPPPEPRLQAVAATLIPAGVSGAELSRLEYCWLALLTPFPWDELVADAVAERGKILFAIGAKLLGREPAEGEPFGVVWSLADVGRRCSDEQSRAILRDRATSAVGALPQRHAPFELAPLKMIAVRRAYDLLYGNGGGWHRILASVRYLLFGRMPR